VSAVERWGILSWLKGGGPLPEFERPVDTSMREDLEAAKRVVEKGLFQAVPMDYYPYRKPGSDQTIAAMMAEADGVEDYPWQRSLVQRVRDEAARRARDAQAQALESEGYLKRTFEEDPEGRCLACRVGMHNACGSFPSPAGECPCGCMERKR
jgi:hypothetical protein